MRVPSGRLHNPAPDAPPLRRHTAWFAGIIIGVTALAYANSWHAPFIFDDIPSIVDNPTIRQLWPLSLPLRPPPDGGHTVSGRPVLNLSFAVNYAISGLNVWSYHAGNLGIHALAALTLFGLVRRTCRLPAMRARFGARAGLLALALAVTWSIHPLQTESVTYVVQRAESLMGFCFLLTFYAFVRAEASRRPLIWRMVSCSACILAVGTKEVAVVIPALLLLYDRTFLSGSFTDAWRRHRSHHVALALTWLPLGWLVASTGGNRGGTMGLDATVSWTSYWLTQFEAVSRYIQLSFWPHPLVFDYGKVAPGSVGSVLFSAAVVAVLLTVTVIALHRRPIAGFCAAWFFVILAPTCIVAGALQMIVEHRMYLPLAGVLALVLGFLALHLERGMFLVITAACVVAGGILTWQRNADYADPHKMWLQTVAQRPGNARAHNNLGLHLFKRQRWQDALDHFRESQRLDPAVALTHYNVGLALNQLGRFDDAVAALQQAVRIQPDFETAHLQLGIACRGLGRHDDAVAHLTEACRLSPASADAHYELGLTFARAARRDDAIRHLTETLRLAPDRADAHYNLGLMLASLDRVSEASFHYAAAVRLRPDFPEAQLNLGIALGQSGNLTAAILHLESAVRLRPGDADAHYNLGYALAHAGRTREARAHFETVLQIRADYTAAQEMLRQLSAAPEE